MRKIFRFVLVTLIMVPVSPIIGFIIWLLSNDTPNEIYNWLITDIKSMYMGNL